MRINKYVALATGMSRRAADTVIATGQVKVNGQTPTIGYDTQPSDLITLSGRPLKVATVTQTILFNKPVGYVVSRDGQGSPTVYDLLPPNFHHLKPIGRLDKNSSGLLLLTNDGNLANELTHPRYYKTKIYLANLDKPLQPAHQKQIAEDGVLLDDGLSKLQLISLDNRGINWKISMHEGRNRQIRRTFKALGYEVTKLHRTHFGPYALKDIRAGSYSSLL